MNEIEAYLEEVKVFQPVSPAQAKALVEGGQPSILYIGRESCPYCRRFVAKLSALATRHNLTVYYLHSQDPATIHEVQQLRDQWQVPTVPGLLYANEKGYTVKCDSSLTPEEILAFVGR